MSHALKSEHVQRLEAGISLARSHPGIPVAPDRLDADSWLFNVINGTINLRNGALQAHSPEDLCTKIAPDAYDPAAKAPRWERFLEQIFPDDDVREFVARAAGYTLTGDVSEQKIFLPYGSGANGKTTFLETLTSVLGDYALHADPGLLMLNRNEHPTGIARLQGARLVVASESGEGQRLAEDVVKRLTGGDRMVGRYMHANFFEFPPTHKIWLQTNYRPEIRGTDDAIWRRLALIPFCVTIPADEQDPHLANRLRSEAPGILAWAVQGCLRWQEGGLTSPLAVQLATAAYRADSDILGDFLGDCCDLAGKSEPTPAEDLYDTYVRWCTANGDSASSQRSFGRALTERGLTRMKHGPKRRWHWIGVRIRSVAEVNP